jgi:hypothetical protein
VTQTQTSNLDLHLFLYVGSSRVEGFRKAITEYFPQTQVRIARPGPFNETKRNETHGQVLIPIIDSYST